VAAALDENQVRAAAAARAPALQLRPAALTHRRCFVKC
jgi:hypothetical protein